MTDNFDGIYERRDAVANWMINEARSIVISGHRDPDQDSLGSQMAVYHVLRESFPDKDIVSLLDSGIVETLIEGRMSSTFNYLNHPGVTYASEVMENVSGGYDIDLFIGLDCSTYDRLPDKTVEVAEVSKNQLFIDHHPNQMSDRKFNVLSDPSKPSTTALLYDFFTQSKYNSFTIPGEAYNAMYFGLVGDTGNFSNSGTSTYSLNLAGRLSEGMTVDPSTISRFYRQKSPMELASSADVVNGMRYELNDRFIYYVHGSPNDSIAEGFSSTNNPVDMLTKVRGYQIAMTAVAIDDDKFRVSIRSSGRYVINDVAAKYQGGGHEFAAGCTCSDSELDDLISELRNKVKLDKK